MDTTQFEAAGLYDPESPTAADRLALLQRLANDGFTIDEMVVAERENRLVALPVERLMSHGYKGGLTLDEVARRTGVEPYLVERAQRALGLPPLEGANYSETSVGAFAAAAAFFGADQALQFSRVLGSSIARIIDAAVSLFVAEVVLDATSESDVAQRSADSAGLLLALPETIDAVFPLFVDDAVRRLRLTTAPSSAGVRVAVGFVDLVGSTRLSQQLSGAELATAVGEFETAAYDLALTHDGRVVKFIGDAAMFVASDPQSACAIGVDLCEVVAGHAVLDTARGAVGLGDAVSQGGDYYGPTVNLVSRLSGVADAGQLLGTSSLATAVTESGAAYAFEAAGAHVLRGFAEPVEAFAIRRISP